MSHELGSFTEYLWRQKSNLKILFVVLSNELHLRVNMMVQTQYSFFVDKLVYFHGWQHHPRPHVDGVNYLIYYVK